MAIVINPNKHKTTRVKNLGWLLKNWALVTRIFLVDGFLIAQLFDGRSYLTSFACLDVAREWLDRPVFHGLPLNDCGQEKEIRPRYTHKRSDVDRVMMGIAIADSK
jgi:hypothetical protein